MTLSSAQVDNNPRNNKTRGSVCLKKGVPFISKQKSSLIKFEMESIKYKMDTLINEKIEAEGRVVQLRKEKETFDAEATRYQ